ncbi:MAG: hypothetical protein AABY50_00775 [Nitrospirota bacterium]
MKKIFMLLFTAVTIAVLAGVVSAGSIDNTSLEGNVKAVSENNMSTASTNMVSPLLDKAHTYIVAENDPCCPAGYPWYRNSTGRCYSTESDCRDTNGGGWSCKQVNQCP